MLGLLGIWVFYRGEVWGGEGEGYVCVYFNRYFTGYWGPKCIIGGGGVVLGKAGGSFFLVLSQTCRVVYQFL